MIIWLYDNVYGHVMMLCTWTCLFFLCLCTKSCVTSFPSVRVKNGIHVLKQHFCQIHQQYDGYILGLWLFKWFLFDEPLEFGYVPSIFQRQAVQQPAALFMNLGKFRLVKYDNLPRWMQEWNHSEGKEETGRGDQTATSRQRDFVWKIHMEWWDSLTIILWGNSWGYPAW